MIGVWGLLGKKIYDKVYPSNGTIIGSTATVPSSKAQVTLTAYELDLDYKDPFLQKRKRAPQSRSTETANEKSVSKNSTSKKINKVADKLAAKPKPIKWPAVDYLGIITLKKGGSAAIISIDNAVENLSRGEKLNDVTVNQIFPDSILITFKEETKTVLRK